MKCYQDNVSNPKEGSDEHCAFILHAGSNLSPFALDSNLVKRRCIEGDTQAVANHLTLALIYRHHHHCYYYCYKATVPPLWLPTSPDGNQPFGVKLWTPLQSSIWNWSRFHHGARSHLSSAGRVRSKMGSSPTVDWGRDEKLMKGSPVD